MSTILKMSTRLYLTAVKAFLILSFNMNPSESMILDDYCYINCFVNKTSIKHTCCDRLEDDCARAEKCGDDLEVAPLSAKLKRIIINYHNNVRNNVATGQLGNFLPPAANMEIIKWDDELALIAQCWVNACEFQRDTCRNTVDLEVFQNFFTYTLIGDYEMYENFEKHIIRIALYSWAEEAKKLPPKFQKLWTNYEEENTTEYRDFLTMVRANVEFIGCALNFWANRTDMTKIHSYINFACNYGTPRRNIQRQVKPVYVKGRPCTHCPKDYSCFNPEYSALCVPNEVKINLEDFNDRQAELFPDMLLDNGARSQKPEILKVLFYFLTFGFCMSILIKILL